MKKTKIKTSIRGFTLIELMVAVSVFSMVMMISMGSILSVLDANRKSQANRTVMDNLNASLESMTREIRFGHNYYCGSNNLSSNTSLVDCAISDGSPAGTFSFTASSGYQVIYLYSSGKIVKNVYDAGGLPVSGLSGDVTSSDIIIDKLTFRVSGSSSSDLQQPRVTIAIKGHSGAKTNLQSTFSVQTTISQRIFDTQ